MKRIFALLLLLAPLSVHADSSLFPNSYSVYINAGHFFKGINAPTLPGVSKDEVTRGLQIVSSNGSYFDAERFHDGTGALAHLYLVGHRYDVYNTQHSTFGAGFGAYATNQSYLSFKYDRHYPTYGLYPVVSTEVYNRVMVSVSYFPKSLSYNLGGSLLFVQASVRLFTF